MLSGPRGRRSDRSRAGGWGEAAAARGEKGLWNSYPRAALSNAMLYRKDEKVETTGSFFYRGPDGPFHELNNPEMDKCILLDVDAIAFQNRTNAKALLYSGVSCVEPPFRALVPGETVDTLLSTAKSVRFEFA
jgi:hypothetical protein